MESNQKGIDGHFPNRPCSHAYNVLWCSPWSLHTSVLLIFVADIDAWITYVMEDLNSQLKGFT